MTIEAQKIWQQNLFTLPLYGKNKWYIYKMNFVVAEREQSAAFEGAGIVGTVRWKFRQFGASGWHGARRVLRVTRSAKSRSTSHVELLRRAGVSYILEVKELFCFCLFWNYADATAKV